LKTCPKSLLHFYLHLKYVLHYLMHFLHDDKSVIKIWHDKWDKRESNWDVF
jgi:hypothetical protein